MATVIINFEDYIWLWSGTFFNVKNLWRRCQIIFISKLKLLFYNLLNDMFMISLLFTQCVYIFQNTLYVKQCFVIILLSKLIACIVNAQFLIYFYSSESSDENNYQPI